MSSHHFVKEGQEPALWIHSVPHGEFWMAYLEWQPRVILDQQALDSIILLGMQFDEVNLYDEGFIVPELPFSPQVNLLDNPWLESLMQVQNPIRLVCLEKEIDHKTLSQLKKKSIPVVTEKYNRWVFKGRQKKWLGKGFLLEQEIEVSGIESLTENEGFNIVEKEGYAEIVSKEPKWILEPHSD